MANLAKASELACAALVAACAIGCAAADEGNENEGFGATEQAATGVASAALRDASGNFVGRVVFTSGNTSTLIAVTARLPAGAGVDGIHGFHVHANDNPANGDGCIADPAQPATTHFVSADGHYNPGGGTHGDHAGDMPALFFTQTGNAAMSFFHDRFDSQAIRGRAVILHQAPDNYGNVPVGAAANQYTPNGPEATALTQATGNAGARIACGVIQ
jgi:superoxide dismutase, Cu-Zn family